VTDALTALRLEGDAFARAIDAATAQQLSRTSNCPPWTLAELVVHTAGSIHIDAMPESDPGLDLHDAADYYRRPERDTPEYRDRNVRQTQAAAARILATTSVAECFTGALQRATDTAASIGMDRVVQIRAVGPMLFGEWLRTRVISVAAHALDVAITMRRSAWTTAAAQQLIRPVLLDLLGDTPPSELGWNDQRFLATATGRSELTEAEQRSLGRLAESSPCCPDCGL